MNTCVYELAALPEFIILTIKEGHLENTQTFIGAKQVKHIQVEQCVKVHSINKNVI